MNIKTVIKADGSLEPFIPEKLNRWAAWASAHGLTWSDIALKAYRKCEDMCHTRDLHKAMIDACVEQETPEHLAMAGRLLLGTIYKEAFGGGEESIPDLPSFYRRMVSEGFWAEMAYSPDELDTIGGFLNHKMDFGYNYTSLRQMKDKYLLKSNRLSLESPQFMFIGMAMQNMEKMPQERRLEDIRKLYGYLSRMHINAPTPMLANMRTKHKGYASCCVYTTEDSAASLAAGDHIAYMMTCASAGIGGFLKTRSKGDPVRKGTISHMGKIPYYRVVQANVHANVQNSRGGSATLHFNVLDPEIEDLLVLKNPTTVAQKQVRNIDYSLVLNTFFVKKAAKNEDWMLVSYQAAPELHESMYLGDQGQTFERLYEQTLKDDKIPKRMINARDIALKALTESVETGRFYLMFADHMNHHTPFRDKIYSSNLCQEIGLPTKGFPDVLDLYSDTPSGEIGLCSLASIVIGKAGSLLEYEDSVYYALLMVDNVIDLMEYPFPSLKKTAKARRSAGIGITNLAHYLASSGAKYDTEEGRNLIHRITETHSFFLHKASLRLARERGVCSWIGKTKYPDGWLPIDTYCRETDKYHSESLRHNWESLRKEIIAQGGIRNSVLEAVMPVESSSQLTNTTNSVYPVRALKVVKTSGNNKNIFLAPDLDILQKEYQFAWDIDTKDLIKVYSIIQKFTGQAISSDFYILFDTENGTSRKVSSKQLLEELVLMAKSGMKTRYYVNSSSGVFREKINQTTEDCEGCKL